MQPTKTPWLVVFALQASLFCAPVFAFCGFYAGKADATLLNTASQVVVARDGNRTVLSMLNNYQGKLSEFALIVPTPVVLERGQVRVADKAVFEHLDGYSSPRLVEYNDSDPCRTEFTWGQVLNQVYPSAAAAVAMDSAAPAAKARDRALGVTVDARYALEEYDIVSLSAKKSDGLETWLRENGYKIPAGASAALRPYINQGMKFFVAKVNLERQEQSGYTMLRPLQFAFESNKFMLPMRLGMLNAPPNEPQDLIVYLLTRQGRVESSNYRTTHLPTGVNLPPFIKPKFQDFYRAMFDTVSKREDYRGVFTEYFWNMSWCDPCAAAPLSRAELEKSGVFWLDDSGSTVLLTRLHVRYTPRTFPEDLMFTQTSDQQNWQARYIVQNPYGGSVAECNEKVSRIDCRAMCERRVPNAVGEVGQYETLREECVAACGESKAKGLDAALRYYQTELPERIASEKRALAELTGWSLHEIDAMPDAQRFSMASPEDHSPVSAPTWWQKLFAK